MKRKGFSVNKKHYLSLAIIFLMNFSIASTIKQYENPFFICIGGEEDKIHQANIGGPLYWLNQELISELSFISDLKIQEDYFHDICPGKNFAPSLNFLQHLLERREAIFVLPKDKIKRAQHEGLIEELLEKAPQLFFQYLSLLQGQSPNAKCLSSKIPEISSVLNDYLHLQAESTYHFYQQNSHQVGAIFRKLRNFDQIYKSCEKDNELSKRKIVFPGKEVKKPHSKNK